MTNVTNDFYISVNARARAMRITVRGYRKQLSQLSRANAQSIHLDCCVDRIQGLPCWSAAAAMPVLLSHEKWQRELNQPFGVRGSFWRVAPYGAASLVF